MKTSEFQQDIGGAVDCMERIIKAAKGCDQLSSKKKPYLMIYCLVKLKQQRRQLQMEYIIVGLLR